MLAYGIGDDFSLKFNLAKNILDKVFCYMNPELWIKDKERAGELQDPYTKVNFEFKKIQAYGRATGMMPQNTMIADALKKVYGNSSKDGRLSGVPGTKPAAKPPVKPDDEVLG